MYIGRLPGALDLAETTWTIQSITTVQSGASIAADVDHVNIIMHNELDDVKE